MPPIFPVAAAACAAGEISPAHAHIVSKAIDDLPLDVQAERDAEIETFLVGEARTFNPRDLQLIARRVVETYDQDGVLASDDDRVRRRSLDVCQHADGTVSGRFHLDPVAGEALLTVLDPLAAPVTDADGRRDPRTATQRRHDGFRTLLLGVLRSGELPAAGGVSTTIVVTMTLQQYAELCRPPQPVHDDAHRARAPGDGLVRTGHGALMNIEHVGRLLGDAQVHPVVLDSIKRIEAYGSTQPFFAAAQRLAMATRDGGCSFPACTVPAAWCEGHHIREYSRGGPTTVDNATLLCGYHHRTFEQRGYRCVVIGGVPHWIAPAWLDVGQTHVRNTAHDPADSVTRRPLGTL